MASSYSVLYFRAWKLHCTVTNIQKKLDTLYKILYQFWLCSSVTAVAGNEPGTAAHNVQGSLERYYSTTDPRHKR